MVSETLHLFTAYRSGERGSNRRGNVEGGGVPGRASAMGAGLLPVLPDMSVHTLRLLAALPFIVSIPRIHSSKNILLPCAPSIKLSAEVIISPVV